MPGDGEIDQHAIVVQTLEAERLLAVYSYHVPHFADPARAGGQRTATALQLDTGVITDAYGRRLSA